MVASRPNTGPSSKSSQTMKIQFSREEIASLITQEAMRKAGSDWKLVRSGWVTPTGFWGPEDPNVVGLNVYFEK